MVFERCFIDVYESEMAPNDALFPLCPSATDYLTESVSLHASILLFYKLRGVE